jgi:hypothetical protein
VQVTWQGACWYISGGHRYQAIRFTLVTATPVPLEGTLFFDTAACSPIYGTDNLNDTGTKIGSGGWLFWFIHHPDDYTTSADWWIQDQHSGCVDYSRAPDC